MTTPATPSPPEPALRHRVEREAGVVRVFLDGEIDMRVAPTLRSILHGIIDEHPDEIRVDLASVPFIDSSGVATLVEALRLLMREKKVLTLENPSEAVRYTLRITQLLKVFGIDDTIGDEASQD